MTQLRWNNSLKYSPIGSPASLAIPGSGRNLRIPDLHFCPAGSPTVPAALRHVRQTETGAGGQPMDRRAAGRASTSCNASGSDSFRDRSFSTALDYPWGRAFRTGGREIGSEPPRSAGLRGQPDHWPALHAQGSVIQPLLCHLPCGSGFTHPAAVLLKEHVLWRLSFYTAMATGTNRASITMYNGWVSTMALSPTSFKTPI